jgi:hypothetical protein
MPEVGPGADPCSHIGSFGLVVGRLVRLAQRRGVKRAREVQHSVHSAAAISVPTVGAIRSAARAASVKLRARAGLDTACARSNSAKAVWAGDSSSAATAQACIAATVAKSGAPRCLAMNVAAV